ncbi:LD-carboxypeptidase [Candidatus Woesearchaeota archaeon CG11_big_fil_rev_8_21_14_0_20_43_8]|nr:MAG: LD-carboxypeptidase [Candidatus Woesearchaeota archaeon CG11_big_fil_rev_8_21_14_0_20_43_8]PIO04893.1 MAG: LD-carboxypeptidase [Candidatus Woesearchaeota archaeon CG08_land_8_20_14_0_20_43_7]
MIKPKPLQKGDTIAIISPSGGLGGLVPHRLDNAKKFLESKGFKVKEYASTRKSDATPEEKVKDLHAAFKNDEVKAVLCAIGGLSSNELLPLIDFSIIKNNPKIFCGYSDITVLHYAFNKKADLVTFYGPAAMTQFGEHPEPLEFTSQHFIKALSGRVGSIKASDKWTDEILDWFGKEDLKRPRKLYENKGYAWINKGKATGKIIGGCLYTMHQINGTDYNLDYKDKILLLETPEGQDFTKGEPLDYVDSQIMNLRNSGIFDKIKGLVVGRGFGYTDEERNEFKKIIEKHTKDYDFPVLFNVDIGHSDPMITIPLGTQVTLDSENNIFSIDESGVQN